MELELTAANCLWPPDAFADNAGRRRTPSIPSCQPADSAHALLAENQISYLSSVASDMMLRRRCRNRTFHGVFGTVVVQRQEREWGPSENGTSVGGRYAGGSLQGAGASLTFGKGFNSLQTETLSLQSTSTPPRSHRPTTQTPTASQSVSSKDSPSTTPLKLKKPFCAPSLTRISTTDPTTDPTFNPNHQ
jgi:hypothetical protein